MLQKTNVVVQTSQSSQINCKVANLIEMGDSVIHILKVVICMHANKACQPYA